VIHDQHAAGRGLEWRGFEANRLRAFDAWQSDLEGGALPEARTAGSDLPLVHIDQSLDDRESDPKSSLGAIERALALHEQVEDARQELGGDARTVVGDLDERIMFIPIGADRDFSAPFCVLGGIRQDVPHALSEAREVAIDIERAIARGGHDGKCVLPLAQLRLDGFDGLRDDSREINGFAPQLNPSLCDAADIEQIIDQARELCGLALYHADCKSCPRLSCDST